MIHGLSTHALSRVKERLHLPAKEVLDLLDANKYVLIAIENSIAYKLFYSLLDDSWFVGVCSEVVPNESFVVTVHPPQIRWEISQQAFDLAKQYVLRGKGFSSEKSENPETSESNKTPIIRFIGFFVKAEEVREVKLFRADSREFGEDMDAVLSHPVVMEKIQRWVKHHIQEQEIFYKLEVQIGRKGERKSIYPYGHLPGICV